MSFPLRRRRRLRLSVLAPGRYLTDGHGLFRVLSRFDDGRSVLVELEDCVTLAAYAIAQLELEAMGFRPVRIPDAVENPYPRRPADPVREGSGQVV